jgi:hypothetical protein
MSQAIIWTRIELDAAELQFLAIGSSHGFTLGYVYFEGAPNFRVFRRFLPFRYDKMLAWGNQIQSMPDSWALSFWVLSCGHRGARKPQAFL